MFDNLRDRLGKSLQTIRGQGRITEDNVQDTLREIRLSLLDADVALPVVKDFLADVKERAIGQEVLRSLDPGQAFIKIIDTELTKIMGEKAVPLDFSTQPPAVILMAGLQGSGKTTSVAKLAKYLKDRENKNVLVASCDVYRPAAMDQLKRLADSIDVPFFPSDLSHSVKDIAKNALKEAKVSQADVLILDTAGRLHIDQDMMAEIQLLHKTVTPIETLFVVDSMTGQDAANSAKAFNDALPLTGVILTKVDGDARGGAALSVRYITGKPIKFLGSGEKADALEVFHPDRIVSRILGMGDMLSIIEEVEHKVDKQKSKKLAKKLRKGHGFNLADYKEQIQQMSNMGGLQGLLTKLPGLHSAGMEGKLPPGMDDKNLGQQIAIINSMTEKERAFPKLINGSRKRRIASGSGTQVQEVNRLLKQFEKMSKMMKKFNKPDAMKKMMRNMQGLLPPDF